MPLWGTVFRERQVYCVSDAGWGLCVVDGRRQRGEKGSMLPESESTAEVHKTGHRIADLSMGLAIHHGHAMDRLVEANSRPFLQFISNNADPTANANGVPAPVLDVWVDNPGSGPARIEWFKIEVDGRQVKDWREG